MARVFHFTSVTAWVLHTNTAVTWTRPAGQQERASQRWVTGIHGACLQVQLWSVLPARRHYVRESLHLPNSWHLCCFLASPSPFQYFLEVEGRSANLKLFSNFIQTWTTSFSDWAKWQVHAQLWADEEPSWYSGVEIQDTLPCSAESEAVSLESSHVSFMIFLVSGQRSQ